MAHPTSWNPDRYAKNARFVSDLGEPLIDLLDPKPQELVLDLGCGDGALSAKLDALGCKVFGVDSSFAQLKAARQRGVLVAAVDGQHLGLKRCFDAVFSNAALHWMKQAGAVVEGVANALKANGRFVGEFGGEGNVETIRRALHRALGKRGIDPWSIDPWYYPSAAEYAQLLGGCGFAVDYIDLIPRPTVLPGDILDWLEIFAQPFVATVNHAGRKSFLEEIRAELKPSLQKPDKSWVADYVRLRFKAQKTAQQRAPCNSLEIAAKR